VDELSATILAETWQKSFLQGAGNFSKEKNFSVLRSSPNGGIGLKPSENTNYDSNVF
jgi:hypothetical protein